MRNLVFVSTLIPYPPDKNGYTENIFHIIKTLKEQYNVFITFIAFYKAQNDKVELEFSKYVDELKFKPPTSKYLYPLIPLKYTRYKTNDVVFFCDFDAGYYQSLFSSQKKLLYSADSPTLYYSKRTDLKAKLFYWKYVVEETVLYPKFTKVIFVSDSDLKFSKKRAKQKGVQIPIGYHLDRVCISSNKKYDLIFSGNFNYHPNRLAAELFLDHNVSQLIKILPNIKVCFVGRKPSEKMIDYARKLPEHIIVTGEVESVEPYLGEAKVYVSPLQNGSGMKNKILQAMAAKLPIVGTRESLSGFQAYNTESTIVVDLEDFNKEIKCLLEKSDQDLEKLGELNKKFMETRYSWNAVIETYYKKILALDED